MTPAVLFRKGLPESLGLVFVILLLGGILTMLAGTHVDQRTGQVVNNFLNSYTLIQTATDASFFAIMAVGATVVIISGGIDLSVGSIYALAGVLTAMTLREMASADPASIIGVGLAVSLGIGLLVGALNGLLVVGLGVHPFIITLGTMWIVRGVAFVASGAESILVPNVLTRVTKASLGFGDSLYPVPMLVMLAVAAAGSVYLTWTVAGRYVFAVGGNAEASLVRRCDRLRTLRDRLGRGGRRESLWREGQCGERAPRGGADRADPAVDPDPAFRPELRMDHHRLRDNHRRRAGSGQRAAHSAASGKALMDRAAG